MKKLSLIITLFLAVLLLQKCKKDTFTETVTSTNTFFAIVNDSTWSADTVTAAMNYYAATNTKVLSATGIADNKEVNFTITQTSAINTAGFPLITFNANPSGSNAFSYYTAEKNASGVNTFYEQGTVSSGSGTMQITAVDSVKKQISGTFSFITEKNNYDNNGNITSVTINEVEAGAFNGMPYTFTSN
jgi:hypothetical protein